METILSEAYHREQGRNGRFTGKDYQVVKMVIASALWLPTTNRDHIPNPSASPHWRFWGTLLWSVLIIIVPAITELLVAIIQIKRSTPVIYSRWHFEAILRSIENNGNVVAYASFVSTIVGCSLIGGIIKLKRGAILIEYLCLYRVPIQTAALWLGIPPYPVRAGRAPLI